VTGTAPRAVAIVLAAGAGRRLGAELPKAFLQIGDRPILAVAAAAAAAAQPIAAVIVTAPLGYEDLARRCVEGLGIPVTVVTGGETRQASVRAALAELGPDVDVVAVHDAARPFASPELFADVVRAVRDGADGAVPVVPVADTVKRVLGGRVLTTIDREGLALAQTPQAFRVDALRDAHERAARAHEQVTDDAMLLEPAGSVVVVPGDPMNFKVTTLLDLARAEARMEAG
jgi:2-C-methyl-D-erythritol 4-phosphate cytidylyltransferase / 2-C-methyl-D-erythritol 2,4-cyclodiphosphate synthase